MMFFSLLKNKLNIFLVSLLCLTYVSSFAQENNEENIENVFLGLLEDKKTIKTQEGDSPENASNINVDNTLQIQGVSQWSHSFMFSKEQMNWMDSALKSRDSGLSIGLLLPGLFPTEEIPPEISIPLVIDIDPKPKVDTATKQSEAVIKQPEPATIAPSMTQITLTSLVHFETEKWSLRLNGQHYTHEDTIPDISVFQINKLDVTFNVKTNLFSLDSFNDERFFNVGNNFVSNDRKIVVDTVNNNIFFTLQPYQSFSLTDLRVYDTFSAEKNKIEQPVTTVINDINNNIEPESLVNKVTEDVNSAIDEKFNNNSKKLLEYQQMLDNVHDQIR